jgi:hypothetical protein
LFNHSTACRGAKAGLAAAFASALAAALLPALPAAAWKPTTHVYLADIAVQDALPDGRVTIPRVDHATGRIAGAIGTYKVDAAILAALRTNRDQYRAGVLGPDAYPDIVTGQQSIHPARQDSGVPGGSNSWLAYLWSRGAYGASATRAFVVGFLTHAAGDMFGHTFVNHFTGGSFTFTPLDNAIKHVIVEGYVDKRLPRAVLGPGFFRASIAGVDPFIYKEMVDARPGTLLGGSLLRADAAGARLSIPSIFSTLRERLQRDIEAYYRAKADYDRRYNACALTDFSCSKAKIVAEKTAYMAANAAIVTYKEYWRNDIDEGLRLWPGVSHDVARALFFNPSRRADVEVAEARLKRYAEVHLTSMMGAPDILGLTAAAVQDVIAAITPEFLLAPLRKLKDDMLNAMLTAAIGMNKEQLRAYLTNPENYFDKMLARGAGEHVSLRAFNATYLKIRDPGYTNPDESFDYRKVPAAYNSVVMSKLILLDKGEVNRLLQDLGSAQRLKSPNIMLGFIRTLDGSRQWKDGMVLAKDQRAYDQVFMRQPGE